MNPLKKQIMAYEPMQHSAVDIEKDLAYKKEFSCNSWFTITHFTSQEQEINVLYHSMFFRLPKIPAVCTSCVSVTNSTTREYLQESNLFLMKSVEASTDRLDIKTKKNHLYGDLDRIKLQIGSKNFQMKADMKPMGYPILNGGTGRFPMIGLDIFQYSMPTLKTAGRLKIGGLTHEINGSTWFDRQWQNINSPDMNWGWMDLNLSNGVFISFWFPVENGEEKPFATMLFPDGRQKVVTVEPVIASAKGIWKSNICKNNYPTQWTVRIPECSSELHVVTEIKEQKLQFKLVKPLNHYEAASRITGTFEDEPVTGHCYVELLAMKPWSQIIARMNS